MQRRVFLAALAGLPGLGSTDELPAPEDGGGDGRHQRKREEFAARVRSNWSRVGHIDLPDRRER